jgi:hypothetical protein
MEKVVNVTGRIGFDTKGNLQIYTHKQWHPDRGSVGRRIWQLLSK